MTSLMEKTILLVTLIAMVLIASALAPRKNTLEMANNNRPKWTDLDIIGLREGFRENLSVADIAGHLLRTEVDVADKALELGISLKLA